MAALLLTITWGAAPSSAATTPLGYRAGYTLLFNRPTIVPVHGFPVYVNRHTPHAGWVAGEVVRVVRAQRAQGINLIWRGYTNAGWVEGAEVVEYGYPSCGRHGPLAVTPVSASIEYGYAMVRHSEVRLCASAFRFGSRVLLGTLLHEMGHGVGLAHMPVNYARRRQVMNPVLYVGSPVTSYQRGDAHGLRQIAAWTRVFASAYSPTGHVDRVLPQADGAYAIDGWTLPGRESADGGLWVLFEDGHPVSSGSATADRPDVDRAYRVHENSGFTITTPALPGQTHTWCVASRDESSPVTSTRLLWCGRLTGPKLVGGIGSTTVTAAPSTLSAGRATVNGVALTQHDPSVAATVTVTIANGSMQAGLWIDMHGSTVTTIAVPASHRFDTAMPLPVAGATYCFTASNGPQSANLGCRVIG